MQLCLELLISSFSYYIQQSTLKFYCVAIQELAKCKPPQWHLEALPLSSESFLFLYKVPSRKPMFRNMQVVYSSREKWCMF